MYWVLLAFSYDAFIIRMLCNGFEIWERVKHIVPVYNAHTSYQIKNLGKILRII
jgi:hypothetical protein